MPTPDNERIAVLETQFKQVLDNQKLMQTDLTEMKEILIRAKGAKWVVVTAAAIGGVIITYLPWVASHIGLIKSG